MASQESTVLIKLAGQLSAAVDLATARSDLDYSKLTPLGNGTGADQANQVWHDRRTLSDGATENLDLNASLTNNVGESVTFTKVKVLMIVNRSTTQDLTVGNAATNGFISWVGGAAHTVTVRRGGAMLLVAPDATAYAATAGTADQLKILNSAGASCEYDIVLIGVN